MTKFDKDVPLPKARRSYDFLGEMEIGDSILIVGQDYLPVRQAIWLRQQRLGIKVVTRKRTKENHGEVGLRVWRSE
jgi:hypothetical protein